jgi:hypothetical protein
MRTFTLTLNEEELKVVIASLEGDKQDLVRGMKKEPGMAQSIKKIVTEAFEQASKIQAYLKYKLNESEKEAKEYERL